MAGLLNTGTEYKNKALSGMIRESVLQTEVDKENENLKTQKANQQKTMIAQGAGLGAVVGMSSAAMGAEYGAMAGPYGAIAGAAAGWLFSELF